MENKKQTAVDWLFDKIQDQRENGNNDLRTTLYYCEQAKEMEKEQINRAYYDGYYQETMYDARRYYDDTYGNSKQA